MKKYSSLRVNLTVFLTSVTLLSYEVILLRVYNILQWQNFFSIIISMAMLGFGVSGASLFWVKKRIDRYYKTWLLTSLLLYPVTLFGGFIITCKISFNPFLLGHDYKQVLNLMICLICMIIPFVFGSAVFGILIQRSNIRRLYFLNLLGAGVGALAVIALLFRFHPFHCLAVVTGISMITASIYSFTFSPKVSLAVLVFSGAFTLFSIVTFDWLGLNRVSEFKSISQTLAMKNSSVLYERFSPAGLIQVVEADGLRNLTGLSLISEDDVPNQRAIFFDGEGMSYVNPYKNSSMDFVSSVTTALPYIIDRGINYVLIPGSGGGEGILRALYFQSKNIDAVEINHQVIDLMMNELSDFSGHIYSHPDVNVYQADFRSFIGRVDKKYDLIDLSFTDSFTSAASGVNSLNESYLYTVESIDNILGKLKPEGVVSITRWINDPPRDNLKLLATAVVSLRNRGFFKPEQHLAAIRSLQTFTLLISSSPFSSNEIANLKSFASDNLFDVVYYPGIEQSETNKYIKLDRSFFHNAAVELLSENYEQFIENYPFNIEPATDNKPYFHNFFRLKTLKHIINYGINWFPVTEWGYLVLIFILFIILVLSFTGILLPIKFTSVKINKGSKASAIYFALIGLSYFFVEISIIQKSVLYIGLPVYSAAIVISGLLVFSGIGSFFSGRILNERYRILLSTVCIGVMLLAYLIWGNSVIDVTAGWNEKAKTVIMLLFLCPLGFFMGIPFPQALTVIKGKQPAIVPWLWGINGFFSVISIVLASLLSIIAGYKFVIITAVATYLSAGVLSIRLGSNN